ncbi:hypothetical protein Hanom_Chr03g00271621 [Helianthus anomalus]
MMIERYVEHNRIVSCRKLQNSFKSLSNLMDGYFWISYVEIKLNDKNVQLQIYPFELIKRMDTCHSKNISYTSYKLCTLYRILNLCVCIYIYIYI